MSSFTSYELYEIMPLGDGILMKLKMIFQAQKNKIIAVTNGAWSGS